jgi:hypothetical protein
VTRIERWLTKDQLEIIAIKIFAAFNKYSRGDPFGWDWPTMRVIFPAKCRVYDRLKTQWRRLINEEKSRAAEITSSIAGSQAC